MLNIEESDHDHAQNLQEEILPWSSSDIWKALSLDLFGKCLRRMFKVLIDNTNLKQLKIYSFNEIIWSIDKIRNDKFGNKFW